MGPRNCLGVVVKRNSFHLPQTERQSSSPWTFTSIMFIRKGTVGCHEWVLVYSGNLCLSENVSESSA